ncbi:MAG: hypothetical protein JSV33_13130 [bacterium]|nr:MAG: hypothetical protein JSV33_13130 [bacterium]
MKGKPRIFTVLFAGLLAASIPVMAIGHFGDWEAQPPGPYTGGGVISHPQTVSVTTAGPESQTPSVPSGEGNILCIDAREQTQTVTALFTYSCVQDGWGDVCQVGFNYSAYNIPTILGGFDVHINAEGDYSKPEYRVYLGKGQSLTRASWRRFLAPGCAYVEYSRMILTGSAASRNRCRNIRVHPIIS